MDTPAEIPLETPEQLRRHAATLRILLLSLPRDAAVATRPALLSAAAWLESAAAVLPPAHAPRHDHA